MRPDIAFAAYRCRLLMMAEDARGWLQKAENASLLRRRARAATENEIEGQRLKLLVRPAFESCDDLLRSGSADLHDGRANAGEARGLGSPEIRVVNAGDRYLLRYR